MAHPINACFISYRHPASAGGREEKLIHNVVRAIKDHFEMVTHEHQVYFDQERLVPGYQYDEHLARAICRSACMVVVYWPSYLESDYCRKELVTMLDIEKRRREVLGAKLHGCRLFIPMILRGRLDDLPQDLHDGCHYLDYTAQATQPNFNIGDDPKMSERLYEVAEYVKSLCDKLKQSETELFGQCEQFSFARAAAVTTASAAMVAPTQPFPGRS